MKKTILTSVAISVGAGIIAGVSYRVGKIVGSAECLVAMLEGMKEAKENLRYR